MALTLESEQRLTRSHLVVFFEAHRNDWRTAAQHTLSYLRENFPGGAAIRPDDVAKPLRSILEVDVRLRNELSRLKLTQKFWISDFVDLIIERTWDEIQGGGNNGQA